jgi:hypothetical protein
MPALRWPSLYGGANRYIPHARLPKVASRGRALTKSTTSILSLDVRSSPASSGRESWGYLNPTIHNSCAFLCFAAEVDDQSVLQKELITVMGGLILSQIFTLYATPVIYLSLNRLASSWAKSLPDCRATNTPTGFEHLTIRLQ